MQTREHLLQAASDGAAGQLPDPLVERSFMHRATFTMCSEGGGHVILSPATCLHGEQPRQT